MFSKMKLHNKQVTTKILHARRKVLDIKLYDKQIRDQPLRDWQNILSSKYRDRQLILSLSLFRDQQNS